MIKGIIYVSKQVCHKNRGHLPLQKTDLKPTKNKLKPNLTKSQFIFVNEKLNLAEALKKNETH